MSSPPPNSIAPSSSAVAPQSPIAPELPLPKTYRISILIRLTLVLLYGALTLPLPFLTQVNGAANDPSISPSISPSMLWVGLAIGLVLLWGALSEQVELTTEGIRVTYPVWFRWLIRKGWFLSWSDIQALKPKTTGQGGLVYYFLSRSGEGYLLPMRVAGFSRLVKQVQGQTGLDMRDVRPLAQPWMYIALLGCALLLLLCDVWVIATLHQV